MTTAHASCPYCNAQLMPPAGARTGQRLPCPRCGEAFVYRGPDVDGAAPSELSGPAGPLGTGPGWSNRRVAFTVVGVMAVMAAVGLAWALWTVSFRRANDYAANKTDPPLPPVRTTPPANLPALGYLPPDTNFVAGIHVAELTQDPAVRESWRRLQIGAADSLLDNITAGTGLTRDDLDHAVLGLRLGEELLPRLTVVVQTRRPYDADQVRTGLKAGRKSEREGKTVYRFRLTQPAVEAALWFAGERTLVVGLKPEDLDAVPQEPRTGSEHLLGPLREMLRERLGPAAPFWLVGHVDDWNKVAAAHFLDKEYQDLLSKMRTLGVWVRFDPGASVNAAIQCTDEAAAKFIDDRLAKGVTEGNLLQRLLPGGQEATAVAQELARTFKHTQQGTWVTAQARLQPGRK